MATLFKAPETLAPRTMPSLSQAGQAVSLRGKYSILVALVLNDVIQLLRWPANTVLEDLILDIDSLDSNGSPTIIPQVGILNAAGTALVGEVMIALTAAQGKVAGIYRPTTFPTVRLQPRPVDRMIGLLVQTAPATGTTPTAVTLNRGAWVPSTAYALGDYLDLPNGTRQKVTTAGISGIAAPDFATTNAATATDGTVTWTNASVVVGLTARFRNQSFGA